MEITIKLKNENELKRIKKILQGEKLNIVINGNRKKIKIKSPNKETLEVFRKTDKGKELVICKDVDDFFKRLRI